MAEPPSRGSLSDHLARAADARHPDGVIDLSEGQQDEAPSEELPRCEATLGPGLRCKYPAVEGSTFCTHHIVMQEPAPKKRRRTRR